MPPLVVLAEPNPGPWWQRPSLAVHYDPRAMGGQPGDLLIGIGGHGGDGSFIVLNHKHATNASETGCSAPASVSEYVLSASEALRASWRQCFPQGMASVRRLVVEDASLDTCMALLLFARQISPDCVYEVKSLGAVQLHGAGSAGAEQRLSSWVDYTTAWEAGRYIDGADFSLSAGCQMAALAHSFLANQETDEARRDANVANALRACLVLLDGYMAVNARAIDAQPPRHLAEVAQAEAQLDFERQLYELALKHGVQTQLLLPMAHSARRLLVDALIVEDIEMSGLLKVLARSDRVNSKTRRGFAVLALYRPTEVGTGGDMVISVDPNVGVSLEALWERLEALENKAWGADRPRDKPRKGVVRYTDPATGMPLASAPNQPWYDEQGRYTLIAAPKQLDDGQLGSRLSWKGDVLPAMWEVFKPFEAPKVTCYPSTGRRVAFVEWPTGLPQKADATPVLYQWLATCSATVGGSHPGDFVSFASLTICSVPGGEVIAHPGGVTLSKDWTSEALDGGLVEAAQAVAKMADDYDVLLKTDRLAGLATELQTMLGAKGRAGEKRLLQLRESTLALKQDLISLAIREDALQKGTGHRALLDALAQAWDLPDARHRLWDTAGRMEELLDQSQALNQARGQFFMTRIVSAAGLCVFVHELIGAVANVYTMNEYERLMLVAEKLGVEPMHLAELQRNSDLSDAFDWSAIAAWLVIFAGALALAWRKYRGDLGMSDLTQPRLPLGQADSPAKQ